MGRGDQPRASRLIRNGYDFGAIEALLDEYKLLEIDIPERSNPGETERIGELGLAMGRSKNYLDNIEPLAQDRCGGNGGPRQRERDGGTRPAVRR